MPPPNPVSISPSSDAQGFTGNVTVTGTNFTPSVTENFIAFAGCGSTSIIAGTPSLDATPTRPNNKISHGVSVDGNGTASFTINTSQNWFSAIAAFDGLVAPTFVQGLSQFSAGLTNVLAYGSANTVGNTLIVSATNYGNFPMTIVDSQGNVWLPLFSQHMSLTNYWQQAWYAPNCAAGANTVTVSYGSSVTDIVIAEYTPLGNLTQVPALVQGTGFTATTPALTGPATLSFSGTGITVNSYGTRNATTLVANITIAFNAALTARDVIVTNADSQTGTISAITSGGFTVTSGAPVPVSVSPPTVAQCGTFNITVTGTNFHTGTLSFSPVLTPLATDNFHQADGPLNPAKWTEVTGGYPALQTLSNVCVGGGPTDFYGADMYTGISFPNDQYVSITMGALASGAYPYIRTNLAQSTGYAITYSPGTFTLYTAAFTLIGTASGTLSTGDVVTLGAIGTTIFVLHNGVQIISVTDATTASGSPSLNVDFAVVQSDTTVTNFVAGSVSASGITVNSYSVQNSTTITANITVDCTTPLGARDVTVTNADTQTGTLAGALTITTSSVPFVSYVSTNIFQRTRIRTITGPHENK